MNYHVKTITADGRKANVVFHIPIPVENNGAGVSLRTALSQHMGTFESKVPWLAGQEVADLQNGELYEQPETVTFLAADSNAQKQAKIVARYATLSVSVPSKVRATLKFWGLDGSVS